ncbi:MAG: chemotaxis protein CheD [Planctomycetes bacterium]|nr:chemotaxis protein CheD [Planctomycetota bacterium]MBL7145790.1 chemotaxis protein CheD [Phycisphaerae bacterium]
MTKNKIIIGISDANVSNNPQDILETLSLGSCIGVCLYDPATTIGGMLHYQLPSSTMNPCRAKQNPLMFADTGMTFLIDKMLAIGVNKKRLQVKIAGGAAMDTGPNGFDIGKRNYLAIKKVLWQHGMFIDTEDVGGSSPRNMYMDIADGTVTIKINGSEKDL